MHNPINKETQIKKLHTKEISLLKVHCWKTTCQISDSMTIRSACEVLVCYLHVQLTCKGQPWSFCMDCQNNWFNNIDTPYSYSSFQLNCFFSKVTMVWLISTTMWIYIYLMSAHLFQPASARGRLRLCEQQQNPLQWVYVKQQSVESAAKVLRNVEHPAVLSQFHRLCRQKQKKCCWIIVAHL